jgi:prolyl-tRNA synthetase
MTGLQNSDSWEKTDRWNNLPVWFKTELSGGGSVGLGWTHEEAVTMMMKNHINSYRDLPKAVYQIQTKYRNEERAKSGLLRGREFLMKDLYSFHATESDLNEFYESVVSVYEVIFSKLNLDGLVYRTRASGGAFSQFSDEFQLLSESGEDLIHIHRTGQYVFNDEVFKADLLSSLKIDKQDFDSAKAIEIGNIFKLGTRFSAPLELLYLDEGGQKQEVIMGCYGLGPSRLLGAIAEVLSDDRGLVWPEAISPFRLHFLVFDEAGKNNEVLAEAQKFYDQLTIQGIEVLFDDRPLTAGEKMQDADLIGLPWRLIVSEKTLFAGGGELKNRQVEEVEILSFDEIVNRFKD